MWQEQQQQRFQQLRQRELEGELSPGEHAELAQLVDELEATEAECLAPAMQRLRDECETVEMQNDALERLMRRKENLVQRLHDFVAEAQAERRAIEGELAAVLVGSRGAKSDG